MNPLPTKNVLLLFLTGLLAGCATDSEPVRPDLSAVAEAMAQQRAFTELHCKDVVADRALRSDHMLDWEDGLYSEYKVWIQGCGKQMTYVVVCRPEQDCLFADQQPDVE